MDIKTGDKFNDGLIVVVGVTPTHIMTSYTKTGYVSKISRPQFGDILEAGIWRNQYRRISF